MNKPVLLQPASETKQKQNALEQLEELRKRIESGETLRFGIIECKQGSDYSTSFSSQANKREDAAMLIELALRMLNFASFDKDGKLVS